MSYYAHYDAENGRILGFYTPDIHSEIPTPNLELSIEDWQRALGGGLIVQDGALVEAPRPEPTLAQRIAALTREYEPQFKELREAWVAVQAAGYGDEAVAEIGAEYQALIAEFNARMEEIGA